MNRRLAFWAILGLGALLYLPALNAFFVADDHLILRKMQEQGVFGIASTPGTLFFRPLTSALYYLDYRLWGLNPLPYHLVSLGWHLACIALVYHLTVRWLRVRNYAQEQSEWIGLGAMALFAVPPAHAEAVAWIASRADMVACAFGLASLICLIRERLFLACLLFGIGLLAKESIAPLPLIALLMSGWRKPEPRMQVLALGGVLVAYLVVRMAVIQGVGGYPEAARALAEPYRLLIHLVVYGLQMVAPSALFGFGRDGFDTLLISLALLSWLAIGVAWLRVRKALPKGWVMWLGAIVLALLPVLAFQPALWHPLNSRYTYFASAFGAILVALVIGQARNWLVARVGFSLLLTVYALGTGRMATYWHDAGEIARSTLQSLRNTPPDEPALLISIPDHYRGAYIWRTSLGHAIRLFAPEVQQPVYSLSRFTLRLSPDTRIEYEAGVARLSNPDDLFLVPEGDTVYPDWQTLVKRIEGNRLEMGNELIQAHTLWSYESARFVKLRQTQ